MVNIGGPDRDRTGGVRSRTFAELLDRRVIDGAYHYATLMMGNRADAEDATHDAALTAWRHLGELRDPAKFEAWFGRIVVNACRDRLRSRRRMPLHVALDPELSSPDPNSGFARRDALADAIRTLSADHREAVVLRYFEDLTVDGAGTDPEATAGRQSGRDLNLGGGEFGEEVRQSDLTVDDLAHETHQIAFDAQECARLHGE